MEWSHRLIRSPLAVGGALLLALVVVIPADTEHYLFAAPNPEDYLWIQGEMERLPYFTKARYLQRYLLHDVARVLFPNEVHRITQAGILLHLVNTLLIFSVFIQLHRTLSRRRKSVSPAALVGAVCAAWVFYFNRTMAHIYISAHAYLLMLTFALITIYLHMKYIREGRLIYWLGVLAAYALGIVSHTFALGLPGFWLLCEWIAADGSHRGWSTRSVLARYTAALAIPVVWIGAHWETYGRALNLDAKGESGLNIVLYFPDYLAYQFTRFTTDASMLASHDGFPLWLYRAVVAVVLILLCRLALSQGRGRGRGLGPWRTVLLFLVVWPGISYPMAILSPQPLSKPWRYYMLAMGIAMVSGYILAGLSQRFMRRSWPRAWGVALLIAVAAVPVQRISAGKNGITTLGRISRGELPANPRMKKCPGVLWCAEVERIHSLQRVKAILAGDRRLACKSLLGLDLSGLDLSGTDLRSANLSAITARGTLFAGADMRRACFNMAILRSVDFRGARLSDGQMDTAVVTDSLFDDAAMQRFSMQKTIFRNCTFRRTDLSWIDADLLVFEGCKFHGANLMGGTLYNTSVTSSDFRNNQMTQTRFIHSFIRTTRFTNDSLLGANLSRSNLVELHFSGADLRLADISRSYLALTRFSGCSLAGANFTFTRLYKTKFGDADLSQAFMTGSGPEAKCGALMCK